MQINVAVKNDTTDSYNVHVYDSFGHGRREVAGSPFALASRETSPAFAVNAADGQGNIAYACESGPSLSDIDVSDGDTVDIS